MKSEETRRGRYTKIQYKVQKIEYKSDMEWWTSDNRGQDGCALQEGYFFTTHVTKPRSNPPKHPIGNYKNKRR